MSPLIDITELERGQEWVSTMRGIRARTITGFQRFIGTNIIWVEYRASDRDRFCTYGAFRAWAIGRNARPVSP